MRGADRAYRRLRYRGFLDLMVNLYPGAAASGLLRGQVRRVQRHRRYHIGDGIFAVDTLLR